MPLSDTARAAIHAPRTSEVFVHCLTISHTLISDILLVNDRVDLVRTAGTFVAFPFTARLHARSEERVVEAEIACDNVDQRIVRALRGLTGDATVTVEEIMVSEPNVVQRGPFEFVLRGYVADARSVALRIGYDDAFLSEAYPKGIFSPSNTSGL